MDHVITLCNFLPLIQINVRNVSVNPFSGHSAPAYNRQDRSDSAKDTLFDALGGHGCAPERDYDRPLGHMDYLDLCDA